MSQKPPARVELLQGTLELLILRTLLPAPAHGHAIAKHIQRTSEDLLQVETGSLYPALHRLEASEPSTIGSPRSGGNSLPPSIRNGRRSRAPWDWF
jgi:hypothetical protein